MALALRPFHSPEHVVKSMKLDDATFAIDVSSELHKIELNLRRQKLEQQWKREGKGCHTPEEVQEMQAWVEAQLEEGAAADIQIKLPRDRKHPAHVSARIDNTNEDYENSVAIREQGVVKNVGDRVSWDGRMGQVQSVKGGICEVKWDKKTADGEEASKVPPNELVLVQKCHPAAAILQDRRPRNLSSRDAKWRYKSSTTSDLALLFSQADEQSPSPDFLVQRDDSRRALVDRQLSERKAKLMLYHDKEHGGHTSQPRSRKLNVQSKFRQKPPFTAVGSQQRDIQKEEGEQLGLVYDPETLCLLESVPGSPAQAFDDMRGMRVTHVSCRDGCSGDFATEEAVHGKEQLRRAIARATSATSVAVRFELWTQRRAVEKKKREFKERLISTKDKKAANRM